MNMTMTILRVILSPNSAGIKALAELGRKIENPEGVMRNIGEALLKVTRQRFDCQTDPQGKAWAPHSKLTQEIRGAGKPILRKTGNLFRYINFRVEWRLLRLGRTLRPMMPSSSSARPSGRRRARSLRSWKMPYPQDLGSGPVKFTDLMAVLG